MFKSLKKYILCLLILLVMAGTAFSSDDLQLTASVDKYYSNIGEPVTLTVSISGNVSNLPEPEIAGISDFNITYSGRSQNITLINGKMSSSISFTYILFPKKTGTYKIPVSINYKGTVYSANTIEVEVQKEKAYPTPSSSPVSTTEEPAQQGEGLFVTAEVDRKNPYIGEQVTLTFRFFCRAQLLSQPEYKAPDLKGFWVEDLNPQGHFYTTIDGKRYEVIEIKSALFPVTPGSLTIGPATVRCSVQNFSKSNDPFQDPFFQDYFSTNEVKVLNTDPIQIEALDLPKPAPSDFKGAVGQFQIEASFDKTEIPQNEPLTLTIKIKGTGNINSIIEPQLSEESPDFKNFKIYDTAVSDKVSKDNYIIGGSKEFKIILIPQKEGVFSLSPINFTYFDPQKGGYETIKSEPLKIKILKGNQTSNTNNPSDDKINGKTVKQLDVDVRYIKPTPIKLKNYTMDLANSPLYWVLYVFPFILVVGTFFYQYKKEKMLQNIVTIKSQRASKMAKSYLNEAKSYITKSKKVEFYTILQKSFLRYVSDKFSVSSQGMTIENIIELLSKKGIKPETIEKLKENWKDIEIARFAPKDSTSEEMKENYNNVLSLITIIDRECKNEK